MDDDHAYSNAEYFRQQDMKAYAGEAIACIFLHSGAESVITLLFLKDGSQERGCSVLMRRDHGVVFRPCSQVCPNNRIQDLAVCLLHPPIFFLTPANSG